MDLLRLPCMPVVAGIPRSHFDATFANFDFAHNSMLKEWTLQFVEGVKRFWLYLSGPTGRGKTHYAVALHRAIVAYVGWEGTDSSKFVMWNDMITSIKASFNDFSTEDLLAGYMECDALVIDDITGKLADFQVRFLEQIVQQRHAAARRLVITSNEPYESWLGNFAAHEVSRIREVCLAVEMGGPDGRDR